MDIWFMQAWKRGILVLKSIYSFGHTKYPRHMNVIVWRCYIGHSLLRFVTTLNSRTSNFKTEHTHFYSMTNFNTKDSDA